MSKLRNYIKNKIVRNLTEGESGYYPPGAEFDPSAPYNQRDNPEIEKYIINYNDEIFEVDLTTGGYFEIYFIDVLEKYWKKFPNSFEQHNKEFGNIDETTDAKIIKKLRDDNFDFSDILMELGEGKGLIGDNREEPDDEHNPDDII